MNAKKAVKWVNALDSVLIAKSRGSEPARNKVAAFDLVIFRLLIHRTALITRKDIGRYID